MEKPDKETIRKAVCKHHGGTKGLSDGQITTIWRSLDPETQARYLSKVRPRAQGKPQAERKAKDGAGH